MSPESVIRSVERNSFRSTILILLTIPLLGVGCGKFSFPGGGEAAGLHEDEPKMVSVTVAAEKLELFMEHPYPVQGQSVKSNVHLTVLTDGMPIRSGKLTMVATGPSGKTAQTEQPGPKSPGIFGPTIAFPEAGENKVALSLQSDQAEETINISVVVYVDEASKKKAEDEPEATEPEGVIQFLKEQAWKIGLVTEPVAKRRLVERLTVPGQIVPPAGAKAVVTPPIAGRVLPPPVERNSFRSSDNGINSVLPGAFPRVGQQVKAGQVVAVIEPPLAGPQGVELMASRAQIQALETELAIKQLEVEAEITKAKIELDQARRVLTRTESLTTQGATAKKQQEEAENALRLAEAAYEGKQQLREPYLKARQELLAMLKSASSNRDSTDSDDPRSASPSRSLSLPLRAPVTGTVTTAQATEGEFVDATKSLFTIINMERVWIEAKVSEYDLERVAKAPAANFTLAAYPGRSFRVERDSSRSAPTNGMNSVLRVEGQLIDVGSVVDATSRTVPVRYEIANPDRLLRIGMFADVAIETARADEMLAIPESAVVDEDGRPIAYVELEGESFQKRDLELGIRDSGFVEVKKGLKVGERVVTKGAYAIRLASVSAVIPAHGHAH